MGKNKYSGGMEKSGPSGVPHCEVEIFMNLHGIRLFECMHGLYMKSSPARYNRNACVLVDSCLSRFLCNALAWSDTLPPNMGKPCLWVGDGILIFDDNPFHNAYFISGSDKSPMKEHIELMGNLAWSITRKDLVQEMAYTESLKANRLRVWEFWESRIGPDNALELDKLWGKYVARADTAFRLAHASMWVQFEKEKQKCLKKCVEIDNLLKR